MNNLHCRQEITVNKFMNLDEHFVRLMNINYAECLDKKVRHLNCAVCQMLHTEVEVSEKAPSP